MPGTQELEAPNGATDLPCRTSRCPKFVAFFGRMFFDRTDFDLASAVPGSSAIERTAVMVDALAQDYANRTAMIFGAAPGVAKMSHPLDKSRRASTPTNNPAIPDFGL
jgi:hypothetical protein